MLYLQVINDIKKSIEKMNLQENQKYCCVMFDEMKIQSDLVRNNLTNLTGFG